MRSTPGCLEKMRISVLTNRTLGHGLGGVQIHVDELAHGLSARGHDVVVLSTSLPGQAAVVRRDNIEVHYLANTPSGLYSRAWLRESVAAFDRLHRERPFDVVLSESLSGSGLIRCFTEIPHLPFLHGLTLEHLVSEFQEIEGVMGALKYPIIKIPEMIFYTLAHEWFVIKRAKAIAVTTSQTMALIQRWYRVPHGVIKFLPNWVDMDLFRPDASRRSEMRSGLGIPSEAFVFLMASVLTKQKGVQVGLEAFASSRSIPNLFLVIVGDGPHRVTLEEQAKALRVEERVRFVGSVPNPEMANYYQAADAFLFPTLRREGLPFVLLEAMASGLPAIASQIGGIPEALGDAGCGFLLPPGDIKALEARMLQFLEDPRSAKQMGEAARERVKRLYEKAEILARIEEVCRELVGTRSGWRR